jgi:hypothetical protein
VLPSIFTVTSVADSGDGTLRKALDDANSTPGPNTIAFQIPGAGVHTIQPTSPLPWITNPVVIDGTTQPDYAGTPLIVLNGSSAGGDGLTITAGNSTVKGLVINGFSGTGIVLVTNGNNVIAGNYIGTDATGTARQGNGYGVCIWGSASNNTVGGTTAGTRNLISGNSNDGIVIADSGTIGNLVQGNSIGTNVNGTAALANGRDGVAFWNNTHDNLVGGTIPGSSNLISGNARVGVFLFSGSTGNVVQGNSIGTNVNGTVALGNAYGVVIQGASSTNTVGGTTAAARNIIAASSVLGIAISDQGTTGNVVQGNYIGTNAAGSAALPNNWGIQLWGGTNHNILGGTAAGAGNLISGNAGEGINLTDSGTTANVVQGNYIGTNADGSAALANGGDGVSLWNGANGNTVGGTAAGAGNLITGNQGPGVFLFSSATANLVQGNYIGTNATGTAALGNPYSVVIQGSATNNTIGGTVAAARNVMAGSNVVAMMISGVGTTGNVVQGNYIGTNVNGTAALGNNFGVQIWGGAANNTIGGMTPGAGNVISGNGYGINIVHSGTTGNQVQGNYIGTDATGSVPVGNNVGIIINGGASNNTVGGSPAAGNVIAFNKQVGVAVVDATTIGNSIRANTIYGNGGLGIDLGWDGVTLNRPGGSTTGPNRWQNYPVIKTASPGSTTAVAGTLNSVANMTFTLDFYASPTPDPSFFGQGQRYLDSATVTTDATGNAAFAVNLSAPTSTGEWITATATDPAGNTSEFSQARQVPAVSFNLNTTTWTPIGPAPITAPGWELGLAAGRINVAAPDPTNANVMYIGGDNGGVWKTTNWLSQTPTWTPLTDNQPSLALGEHDLVVFPGNSQILYGAAAGPSGGILKSTDGGASWTYLANALFDQAGFGAVVVNPSDPNNVYVAEASGPSGGVYRSDDGGQTWVNTTAGVHGGWVSDLVMDPTNPSVLYAGFVYGPGGVTNGIYKTSDGGVTWTRLTNGVPVGPSAAFTRLALAPSAPQTVYATVFNPVTGHPQRYKTTNGGTAWAPLNPVPNPQEDRTWHVLLAVDPTDPQVIYVNGDHAVYVSMDGGGTWRGIFGEDPVGGYFDAAGGFLLVGDRGINRTPNRGTTWDPPKHGNLQLTEFYTLTLDPTNLDVAYGIAQDHNAMKFTGLPVWNYLVRPDETGKFQVDPVNPNRLYAYDPLDKPADTGFFIRSDDGGVSWVTKATGLDTSLAGDFGLAYATQKSLVMDPGNRHRLVLGIKRVYETTNDADSWTAISPELSPGQFITAVASLLRRAVPFMPPLRMAVSLPLRTTERPGSSATPASPEMG